MQYVPFDTNDYGMRISYTAIYTLINNDSYILLEQSAFPSFTGAIASFNDDKIS